jgi:4-hydroxy-tetrahydrodipicolinate reductase
MGSAVAELVAEQPDIELAGGIEAFGHVRVGQPLGTGMITAELGRAIGAADVVVEFSSPVASLEHLRIAATQHKPYVLGTTGFDAAQQAELKDRSRLLPLVWAPNFSVGINVLYRLTDLAARTLKADYDVEIVEIHHRRKKDAPSGTARHLAEIVKNATGRTKVVHGREGQVGEKPGDEIGVVSIRSGDIVGEHYVIMGTEGERIELVHKASSRLAFAQGTLRAIRFVAGKPNGLYCMDDVLGFRALGPGAQAPTS